jgi:glycosyltransferase involved in cell wall biosynthesis
MMFGRKGRKSSPRLSITVIVYNMQREAPRTLHSLSADYQQGVEPDNYEIIVVENGSTRPLGEDAVSACGPNFRYIGIDNAHPSPAAAVNRGVALSRAANVGVMIDGARMATPGIVRRTLDALETFRHPVVATIALHLGPDVQFRAMANGYNAEEEDRLLAGIDWPQSGYRLFEIGVLAGSSSRGWLGPLTESSLVSMPRTNFERIGGMDERFAIPGGGFVNLDFYKRLCELPDIDLVCILGEATFHQIHGGTMTNSSSEKVAEELRRYGQEYERIRGCKFAFCKREHLLYGFANRASMKAVKSAADWIIQNDRRSIPSR